MLDSAAADTAVESSVAAVLTSAAAATTLLGGDLKYRLSGYSIAIIAAVAMLAAVAFCSRRISDPEPKLKSGTNLSDGLPTSLRPLSKLSTTVCLTTRMAPLVLVLMLCPGASAGILTTCPSNINSTTLCGSACSSTASTALTFLAFPNEYYYKTSTSLTCSACSSVATSGEMYVYQAYTSGTGAGLSEYVWNAYVWFNCATGRWTRSVIPVGYSPCLDQFACPGPYPAGTILDTVPEGSSCPYSGAASCLRPPPPSPPSPPLPPPSPPGTYFAIAGPCTIDPRAPNCIRSPNYPADYNNSQACSITPTLLAIGRPLSAEDDRSALYISPFNTQHGYDFLRIPSHPSGTLTNFSGAVSYTHLTLPTIYSV